MIISVAVLQRSLLGSCEKLGLEVQAWRWCGTQGTGGRVTRMKESEKCPRQVEEEQTQRQEESQEAAKSRSPGSGKFQGWGVNRIKCHRVTSSVRSGKFALGCMAIPETFERSTWGNQYLEWESDLYPDRAVRGLSSRTFYSVSFIFMGLALLLPLIFSAPL